MGLFCLYGVCVYYRMCHGLPSSDLSLEPFCKCVRVSGYMCMFVWVHVGVCISLLA